MKLPVRTRSYCIVLLLLLPCSALRAQGGGSDSSISYKDSVTFVRSITEHDPFRFFAGGGVGLLFFKDNALPSPLSKNCDAFLNGKGTQPYLNLGADFPLDSGGTFHFRPLLFYEGLGGDHTWAEYLEARDSAGNVRTVEYDHTITNHTKSIGAAVQVQWDIIPHLSIGASLNGGLLFDQTYLKIERATSDGDLIRVGNEFVRERIDTSGDIPDAAGFLASMRLRIAASIPLSKLLRAEPNISFTLPLTHIAPYWSHYSLRGGIDFCYEITPSPDTIVTERHIAIPVHKPVAPTKPSFTASVEISAVGPGGKNEPVARLIVNEVKARNAYPVLNYIFFDSASSAIAPRYIQYRSAEEAARSFKGSIERRGERTSDLYLETLNIIGDRLKRQPTATVRLVGSNSGSDEGSIELARRRAEAVKSYFHRIWGIDDKRMTTVGMLLPERPSPNAIVEGQAENRRVEIISNDLSITDPLYVTNAERTANPPELNITQSFDPDSAVRAYRGSFRIGNIEVSSFEGDSASAAQGTRWTVTEEALASNADSLVVELRGRNASGQTAFARAAIKLEQHKTSSEQEQQIDRFSLILFGFDESSLGSKNERTLGILAEALKRIKPKSISIIGYTDELGDEAHNNSLSYQRAQEAAAKLEAELRKRNIPMPLSVTVEGRGSRGNLYDNRLPEGRFFSRTVLITIER